MKNRSRPRPMEAVNETALLYHSPSILSFDDLSPQAFLTSKLTIFPSTFSTCSLPDLNLCLCPDFILLPIVETTKLDSVEMDSHAVHNMIPSVVLTALAIGLVTARVYARSRICARLELSDWVIVAALVTNFISTGGSYMNTNKRFFGVYSSFRSASWLCLSLVRLLHPLRLLR